MSPNEHTVHRQFVVSTIDTGANVKAVVEVDLLRLAKFLGRKAAYRKGRRATACLGAVEVRLIKPESK